MVVRLIASKAKISLVLANWRGFIVESGALVMMISPGQSRESF
jgi:hypothetical protein